MPPTHCKTFHHTILINTARLVIGFVPIALRLLLYHYSIAVMASQPGNPNPPPGSGPSGTKQPRKRAANWSDVEWEDLLDFLISCNHCSTGSCFTDVKFNEAVKMFREKYPDKRGDTDGKSVSNLYSTIRSCYTGYMNVISPISGAGGSAQATGDLVFEAGSLTEQTFDGQVCLCKNKKLRDILQENKGGRWPLFAKCHMLMQDTIATGQYQFNAAGTDASRLEDLKLIGKESENPAHAPLAIGLASDIEQLDSTLATLNTLTSPSAISCACATIAAPFATPSTSTSTSSILPHTLAATVPAATASSPTFSTTLPPAFITMLTPTFSTLLTPSTVPTTTTTTTFTTTPAATAATTTVPTLTAVPTRKAKCARGGRGTPSACGTPPACGTSSTSSTPLPYATSPVTTSIDTTTSSSSPIISPFPGITHSNNSSMEVNRITGVSISASTASASQKSGSQGKKRQRNTDTLNEAMAAASVPSSTMLIGAVQNIMTSVSTVMTQLNMEHIGEESTTSGKCHFS